MEQRELNELLSAVAAGEVAPDEAAARLRTEPFSDLGFAKVDHHRGIRQGVSEVVYGQGKTPDQIAGIIASMLDAGQERIMITRLEPDAAQEVEQLLMQGLSFATDEAHIAENGRACGGSDSVESVCTGHAHDGSAVRGVDENAPTSGAGIGVAAEANQGIIVDAAGEGEVFNREGTALSARDCAHGIGGAAEDFSADGDRIPELPVFTYYDLPRIATIGEAPEPDGMGTIVVACGGTSDIYVAEEAALTAEMLGNEVVRLYDVGVAGLHRLLAHTDELASARVVVAVAGMEGALASVIGGLVSCPVIAVPTSVGYGASFGGVSALLAMLNSCASGVSVVNIDNGFGAGYQASLINHL